MNRRNRTLLVLIVAVGLASVATYFVYRAISRIPVRQVEVASVYVAVAAENLPTGTRLTKDHIKIVGWPSSSPVQGSFASPDPIVGRGLIQSVRANEPLTESKLAPIEAGAGLAAIDSTGNACAVGAGERRDWRCRLHRAGHSRRCAGDDQPGENRACPARS